MTDTNKINWFRILSLSYILFVIMILVLFCWVYVPVLFLIITYIFIGCLLKIVVFLVCIAFEYLEYNW